MNLISPISASFAASQERNKNRDYKANDNKPSTLPVVINQYSRGNVQTPAIYGQSAFVTQLIAGQPRRGIKASREEQQRYFSAYEYSATAEPAKHSKCV